MRITEAGPYYLVGDVAVLRAKASDSVDGALSDSSIAWFIDSVPGAFGSGDSVALKLTIPGTHTITARATNRAGGVGQNQVSMLVGANGKPHIAAIHIITGNRFFQADTARFNTTAVDSETPSRATIHWVSDLDGEVGTGDTLTTFGKLRPGAHNLMAIAVDPEGLADTTSIPVTSVAMPDRVKWTHQFPGLGGGGTLINLADDGTIVFALTGEPGCGTSCLHAVRPDGTEKWHLSIGGQIYAHSSGLVTAPDGRIFAFDGSGNAYGISAAGAFLWQQSKLLGNDPHGRLALGPDGALYATGNSTDNKNSVIARISPIDGTEMWTVTGSPAFHDHGVFIDPAGHAVAELRTPTQSAFTWVNPNGTTAQAVIGPNVSWSTINRGAMGADGTMFLSKGDGSLVAIAPDGSRPWSAAVGGAVGPSEPVIDGKGIIYFSGDATNGVRALKASDGSIVWQTTLAGVTFATEPALTSDGGLVLGTNYALSVLSTTDGSVRWSIQLDKAPDSPFVIAADGTIYFVTNGGRLFAVKGDAPLAPDSPWSTYRGNNRNTASVQH